LVNSSNMQIYYFRLYVTKIGIHRAKYVVNHMRK
jgi:hypothetical protein